MVTEAKFEAKQIVELLYRCLDEGFDAVMQGVSVTTPPPPKIADTVVVQSVNLAGYDVLFGGVRV